MNSLSASKTFETKHEDFVHHIAYDYYGKRLATCSSDQKIKVWDKESDKDDWHRSSEWTAHDAAIWKVAWADPEFGQIIASCSFDKTVRIWEEKESAEATTNWIQKAKIVEFKESVEDIKFSPKQQGLQLAICVCDGTVKIWEAKNIMNLASWTMIYEFQVNSLGCNCLAWNPSPFEDPMLIIGSNDLNTSFTNSTFSAGENKNSAQYSQKLVHEGLLQIWGYKKSQRAYVQIAKFDMDTQHKEKINDVAWAPLAGRSYHLIASCSKDKHVKIWRVEFEFREEEYKSKIYLLSDLADHEKEVWRVSWNILGTCLASSGDDNVVRVWKMNLNKQFFCIATIRSKQEEIIRGK